MTLAPSAQPLAGIQIAKSHHVLTITIDRPERRNAVTLAHLDLIAATCEEAERDDDVRAVVLAGNAESFCAGVDLGTVDLESGGGLVQPPRITRNFLLPLLELTKPLIGSIGGIAAGGGLGLALCCDIRLASPNARFATAFSRIGLTATDAVAWLLPRTVGLSKSLEMIYLGDPIDATEALRIGLIDHLVPADELNLRVRELATRCAAGPPVAIRMSKVLVRDGLERTFREHMLAQEYASLANRTVASHDLVEGGTAFKEKRSPRFRGLLSKRSLQDD